MKYFSQTSSNIKINYIYINFYLFKLNKNKSIAVKLEVWTEKWGEWTLRFITISYWN